MYKVAVTVSKSDIDGEGVFASEDIDEGTKVWVFTDNHDITINKDEYDTLSDNEKAIIGKVGYLSPWTGLWVYPPEDDPARYTNHSKNNNLSVVYDPSISIEPYFIANRDIKAGEELTNNYLEFDKISQDTKPEWVT